MGIPEHEIGDLVLCHENGFGWIEELHEPKSHLSRSYPYVISWEKSPEIANFGYSEEEVASFKENLREKLYAETEDR